MELKTNFWIEATLKYRITFLFIMEIDSVTFALILVEKHFAFSKILKLGPRGQYQKVLFNF